MTPSWGTLLSFLQLLLLDFTHHYIEMTCNLLETCGRYLFQSNDSHHRCKLLLDQMMRKKALMAFDSRYITTIENAYFFANPPESQAVAVYERPRIHEFIRKLLYQDLRHANEISHALKLLRKLDWSDPDVAGYATRCLIAGWQLRFLNICWLANLVADLSKYQEWAVPRIIGEHSIFVPLGKKGMHIWWRKLLSSSHI